MKHQTEFYTYYPEKIKVIGIVPIKRMNYYMRRYNKKKRIYFYTLWLNSISYIFEYLSYKEIYFMVKSMGLSDLPDEYILHTLKNYNIHNNHFYIYTNFKWNKEKLYSTFKSKIEVDKYKRSIINKYNRLKFSSKKEEIVLEYIKNNNDITKTELLNKIKKDVSKNTLNKILKNNDIELSKNNLNKKMIDEKLKDLFKYKVEKISKKLTNQLLANYCGVSLSTFKRYIKDSEYKKEIKQFNIYLKNKIL